LVDGGTPLPRSIEEVLSQMPRELRLTADFCPPEGGAIGEEVLIRIDGMAPHRVGLLGCEWPGRTVYMIPVDVALTAGPPENPRFEVTFTEGILHSVVMADGRFELGGTALEATITLPEMEGMRSVGVLGSQMECAWRMQLASRPAVDIPRDNYALHLEVFLAPVEGGAFEVVTRLNLADGYTGRADYACATWAGGSPRIPWLVDAIESWYPNECGPRCAEDQDE
jgi:hypothetical protein